MHPAIPNFAVFGVSFLLAFLQVVQRVQLSQLVVLVCSHGFGQCAEADTLSVV